MDNLLKNWLNCRFVYPTSILWPCHYMQTNDSQRGTSKHGCIMSNLELVSQWKHNSRTIISLISL